MKVKDCNNCPFMTVEYDDFAMGSSTTIRCNLMMFKNFDDYFLTHKNNSFRCEDGYIKKDCPLKKEELIINKIEL